MKRNKTLQDLNLADDFLFAKVMENEEVCKKVLEKILGFEIKKVRSVESQLTKDVAYDAKSIRLDIFLTDDMKNAYTVEMQTVNKYNISKRARYYHGVVDVDQLLKEGMSYNELNDNYVIFICTFDALKKGLHQYTFESICIEDGQTKLNDGVHTIVLNTKGVADDVDAEMKAFLDYVENSTDEIVSHSNSSLLNTLHKQVKEIKSSSTAGVEYMKLDEMIKKGVEEGREEGIRDGRAQGIRSEKICTAKKLLGKGLNKNEIEEITGLSKKEIEEL